MYGVIYMSFNIAPTIFALVLEGLIVLDALFTISGFTPSLDEVLGLW